MFLQNDTRLLSCSSMFPPFSCIFFFLSALIFSLFPFFFGKERFMWKSWSWQTLPRRRAKQYTISCKTILEYIWEYAKKHVITSDHSSHFCIKKNSNIPKYSGSAPIHPPLRILFHSSNSSGGRFRKKVSTFIGKVVRRCQVVSGRWQIIPRHPNTSWS